MRELPVSDKIRMRPVWARRQRRRYFQGPLAPPTRSEFEDALAVLRDEENRTYAPALWAEALLIVDEAWSRSSATRLLT